MFDVSLERDCSVVALDFDFLDDLLDGAANATSLSATEVLELDSLGGGSNLLDVFLEAGSSLISLSELEL